MLLISTTTVALLPVSSTSRLRPVIVDKEKPNMPECSNNFDVALRASMDEPDDRMSVEVSSEIVCKGKPVG
ncbi:hypothetical protein FQN50_008100 [Emmonsiellopsis sp. PD_5]|nr:hypothetical protein FQN50_008100 [Emmonsiellopsis sp. PD_5]